MRQLTSLDAQFLAMETPQTWGHVSGLAIYDPSTVPGGQLTTQHVCRVLSQRLHLLPPFRWRLVWVPFGLDHPYWIEDPNFDLDFHLRDSAVPPPGIETVPGVPTIGRAASRMRRVVSGSRDGEVLERPTSTVPRTRFNARLSPHRRFSFGQLPLDRIKAVKNELGITVNDVVVALCAGALRRWMLERDELPDDPLVAMVPVSVRTQEQMGTFGNRVSAMFVPIPTDVADPRDRLLRAHEILKGAKDRHRALPATLLQDATQFIPPAVYARA